MTTTNFFGAPTSRAPPQQPDHALTPQCPGDWFALQLAGGGAGREAGLRPEHEYPNSTYRSRHAVRSVENVRDKSRKLRSTCSAQICLQSFCRRKPAIRDLPHRTLQSSDTVIKSSLQRPPFSCVGFTTPKTTQIHLSRGPKMWCSARTRTST